MVSGCIQEIRECGDSGMKIAVDKAQKDGKHDIKHNQMIELGHELTFLPLPVGDYMLIDDTVQEVINRRGDKLKKMDLIGCCRRSVDTKQDMNEVYGNIIGKSHSRFRDELILAQQNGIELIILVESGPEVQHLDDVKRWQHWGQLRAYCRRNGIRMGKGMLERIEDYAAHGGQRPPATGEHLYKCMMTLSARYGVRWCFCPPEKTGKAIIYLLTRE